MTDVTSITDEKRAEIKVRLTGLEARRAPLEAAIAPLRAQMEAIDAEEDEFLDAEGVEIAGTCETCGRLLLAGDRGSEPYEDEAFVFCAEHSMSYRDVRHYWTEEFIDDGDPDTAEAKKAALDMVEAHLAAGGSLDDKVTHVLEARL